MFQRISVEKEIPSGGSQAGDISQTSCPGGGGAACLAEPSRAPGRATITIAISIIITTMTNVRLTLFYSSINIINMLSISSSISSGW